MADIIPLPGDRHRETLELLPWFVTGAIEPADKVKVQAHLADCAECRSELALERALHEGVASLPIETEPSFAEFRRRLAESPAIPERNPHLLQRMRATLRQPGHRRNWAIAAQAAVVLLVVGLALPSLQRPGVQPASYRTLGSGASHPAANVLVMFRPDTSEAEMRALMTQNGARVVDGPTVTGAYMLDVPAERRASVLANLRAQRAVTLAQPIDPGPQ